VTGLCGKPHGVNYAPATPLREGLRSYFTYDGVRAIHIRVDVAPIRRSIQPTPHPPATERRAVRRAIDRQRVTLSREADGWSGCFSCAQVPPQPVPLTSHETGIAVGVQGVLVTAEGESVATPRHSRGAEKALAKAQRRVSRRTKGSKRRNTARKVLAKKPQQGRRHRQDFPHQTALALVPAYETIYRQDVRVATICGSPLWDGRAPSARAAVMPLGGQFRSISVPSLKPQQQTLGVRWWPSRRSTPARIAQAAQSGCRKVGRYAPLAVPLAGWCWIAT